MPSDTTSHAAAPAHGAHESERYKLETYVAMSASSLPLPVGIARVYDAILMQPGEPNGWTITPDVLSASVSLWEGADVYADHAPEFPFGSDDPSIHSLIGVIRHPSFSPVDPAGIHGELHMLAIQQAKPTIELLDTLLAIRQSGDPAPQTGLSAVLSFKWAMEGDRRIVLAIKQVWSVDVVFRPAAGGDVVRILNSCQGWNVERDASLHAAPSIVHLKERSTNMPPDVTNPLNPIRSAGLLQQSPSDHTAESSQAASFPPPASSLVPDSSDLTTALMAAQCEQLLATRLLTSGFPPAVQARIRTRFTKDGRTRVFHPAELDAEIDGAREIAAAFHAPDVIQGAGNPAHCARVTAMFDQSDQVQAAYELLMGITPDRPELRNVPRLSGIRELYIGLTGDRELRGVFQPDKVLFAIGGAASPATCSGMASLTANVMNKLLVSGWDVLAREGYDWWRRCCAIANFPSLQQTSWVVAGGFGNLPTVNEGAVYTEITWDDKYEPISFVKKGGFVSLTLEMIDKDDTGAWRNVGFRLGTAAIRTLSASVASILTTNAALSEDSVALFHATHANLLGYDLDTTGWEQAVNAMFAQTEVNSSKTLGLRPDRVLVPIQKRARAMHLFYSDREPGGDYNDINVARLDATKDSAGPVIICPDLSDTNAWYAFANPLIAPALGVGFRFGETPEIFSVADPNSYLMFYQDALPIKARFFYAAGAIGYRSIVKSTTA